VADYVGVIALHDIQAGAMLGGLMSTRATPLWGRLVTARKEAKLTQADVQRMTGWAQSTVSDWETGKVSPDFAVRMTLGYLYLRDPLEFLSENERDLLGQPSTGPSPSQTHSETRGSHGAPVGRVKELEGQLSRAKAANAAALGLIDELEAVLRVAESSDPARSTSAHPTKHRRRH
jgi:DNA-binding XRE family transcriptional regulator